MCYAAVIEKGDGNYPAYVPDLPGCVATGGDRAGSRDGNRDAIRFPVEGFKADGPPIPNPTSIADDVEP